MLQRVGRISTCRIVRDGSGEEPRNSFSDAIVSPSGPSGSWDPTARLWSG
jgi:hypothetical protein